MIDKKNFFLYAAWMAATVSTAGSFFFSYFLKFEPCVLCWYQRIFMFPLVLVLGAGFILQDKKVYYYSAPLALIGWLIGFYHNLLYYGFISPELTPCAKGVSCTEKHLALFGFISIPLLSLASFSVIVVLIYLHHKKGSSHETK